MVCVWEALFTLCMKKSDFLQNYPSQYTNTSTRGHLHTPKLSSSTTSPMGKKSAVRVKQIQKAQPSGGGPMMDMMGGMQNMPAVVMPPPNPNLMHRFGVSETETDFSSYSTLWPTFLDSTKTIKRGRKISTLDSPGEDITIQDIHQACVALRLPHVIEVSLTQSPLAFWKTSLLFPKIASIIGYITYPTQFVWLTSLHFTRFARLHSCPRPKGLLNSVRFGLRGA